MTTEKAKYFFKMLLEKTENKSEQKVYIDFIDIIEALTGTNLTGKQLLEIEQELDNIAVLPQVENRKKHFGKQLSGFKLLLRQKYNLIAEGFYTSIGIALGTSFGVALGTTFGNMFDMSTGVSMGISFGLVIGLIIGKSMDAKAEKEKRVLKTTPKT